ncbi:TPA: hypothetical protein DD425_00515 [Candidatus Saccharibacteria bacterium]|nr:hypothetical protein [Candidatus Saccharibacteria bacterium]|tara:strand:- start:1341 stop:2486 length:1146 start_codon:yes stop_codon:yes gene_type:complete
MQKVVLLIRNAAQSDFGGAETYQISLAKTLEKLHYQPIIVSRSVKLINYAKDNSIQTIRGWWWSQQKWNGARTLLIPFYIAWQIALTLWYVKLIINTKASILHIQSKDDFIAASIAGRILQKVVVWTDHMDLRYIFQNITKPLRNPIGKMVFYAGKLTDHIIIISNNEYALITSQFKKNSNLLGRLVIVNNGVIDHKIEKAKQSEQPFIFCLASRIVKNKGIGESIDAFLRLKQKVNTPIELHIYGDGADMALFKNRAKPNKAIKFFGHQENVIEQVAKSDVYMLPSYQEGFSIALLEATMLGKAIITSDIDSNSEIIQNNQNGLLVRAQDVDELEHAMYRLLSNPELILKLEKNARNSYKHNFNLERIAQTKILPLYESR